MVENKVKLILNHKNWNEIRGINEDQEVITSVDVIRDFLPKKIAALEVYKEVKKQVYLSFAVVFAALLSAIFSFYNILAGSIVAGIFSVFSAYFIKKAMEKKLYFETEYNLKLSPLIKDE